jgi:ribosomal protein L37E
MGLWQEARIGAQCSRCRPEAAPVEKGACQICGRLLGKAKVLKGSNMGEGISDYTKFCVDLRLVIYL